MKTETALYTVVFPKAGAMRSDSFPKVSTKANTISDRQPGLVFHSEDDGTGIYSRSKMNGQVGGLEGRNFFDEIAGFEDIAEYRRNFHSSVKSNKAVESFIWRRSSAGQSINTKILMTRAYQTGPTRRPAWS